MVESVAIELKRTFLDDVDDLTVLLYKTVQRVSPSVTRTSNLDTTIRDQVTPAEVPVDTIDYDSFIRLCGDYITAHPFEQTLQRPISTPHPPNGTSSSFKR